MPPDLHAALPRRLARRCRRLAASPEERLGLGPARASAGGAGRDPRGPAAHTLESFGLEGDWHRRVLRVAGEPARLEVNGWFTCRLADDGTGLALVNDSGAWRTRGRLFDRGENRMACPGSRAAGGDESRRGADPARDHFGVAAAPGPGRRRIEFPPREGADRLLEVLEPRRGARTVRDLCMPEMPTDFACPRARRHPGRPLRRTRRAAPAGGTRRRGRTRTPRDRWRRGPDAFARAGAGWRTLGRGLRSR